MSERDIFERRLEAAVRDYVEAAPTQIDAARLTDSLATNVPRMRRLVPLPAWRLPSLGFAWILVVTALLAVLGMGLIASGALENVRLLPAPPAPPVPVPPPPMPMRIAMTSLIRHATARSVMPSSLKSPASTSGAPCGTKRSMRCRNARIWRLR